MIGVILVMVIFARRTKRNFFQVADFIAPLIPFGLGAGRLGNFINGELWGRVDPSVPFTMLFPGSRAEDIALLPSHTPNGITGAIKSPPWKKFRLVRLAKITMTRITPITPPWKDMPPSQTRNR